MEIKLTCKHDRLVHGFKVKCKTLLDTINKFQCDLREFSIILGNTPGFDH